MRAPLLRTAFSIAAVLLITLTNRAQIIYTDVVPDAYFFTDQDSFHLDLNNDDTTDFELIYRHYEGANCIGNCTGQQTHPSSVRVTPLGANAVLDSTVQALCLDSLAVIDSTKSFDGSPSQIMRGYSGASCVNFGGGLYGCLSTAAAGNWLMGNTIHHNYLGLRLVAGGAAYYGWVAVLVSHTNVVSSFKVFDYAYNSVPDELILAGDTMGAMSTGVVRYVDAGLRIVPNPTTGMFTIAGLDASLPTDLEVRNAMGQLIIRSAITGMRSGINLAAQPGGVYFLTVRSAGSTITKSLIKE